ncbi:apolipoprotein N-acyltransferase [Chitinophaga deserti]|uniref:apolipoprotein N-acyltransferase n=1 Tax=Chitinophaga deserti TaxID=2164099 RepID=UPI000D6A80E5|nr:apolipoprotein N-acyltransferase [Chitinophaga deserti]
MNAFLQKRGALLLSILSGLLFWAAWPTSPLTFLIFFAFVPLLAMSDRMTERPAAYFGLLFLAFWIWNTATTWWVGNTPVPASGIFANAFNALLMTLPWLFYRTTRLRAGRTTGYFALAVYWMTFEYIHQQWELSWPWLTLGNAFAMRPGWVQWYEYLGTEGGSWWVLIVNILIYRAILHFRASRKYASFGAPAAVLLMPILISLALNPAEKLPGESKKIVVVQPNIDPYDEKYARGAAEVQLRKLLDLTAQQTDSNTRFIIWPETALFTTGAWEHELNNQPEVLAIRQFLQQYPKASIITGASTYLQYTALDNIPGTARHATEGNYWYDAFNSSIQIDTSSKIQVYHKAKLVPGVELTPYMRYFPFMKKLALDMGGITGSYGLTPGVPLFTNADCNVYTAICYESVYGSFVAQKVREGAQLLVVATNDGWWGDSEGHRQHMQYARLRAIETRRWVARSANTGISCLIDPAGKVLMPLPYWEPGVIAGNIQCASRLTFYVKYSAEIAFAPVIFCILLLTYTIVLRVIRKKNVENIR